MQPPANKRRNLHPTAHHDSPQVLVNLPILLIDVLVMGTPVYFMVGFTPAAGPFFTFLLIMLLLNMTADNFYRWVLAGCS